VPSKAPSYDYAALLGKIATLKPCGENVSFDAGLPRAGTLTRQIGLGDWGDDWLVMTFEEPLNYKGEPVPYCLIRARWNGCPVGSEFCPVFVLTDAHGAVTRKNQLASSDFQFVSWAEIELAAQPGSQPDAAR
jgi:hypothetical protein